MRRLSVFRWLAPGIRIKRWLLLFGIGVIFLIMGVLLMLNYRWLSTLEDLFMQALFSLTGAYDYTNIALIGGALFLVGTFFIIMGSRKTVLTIVRAILPDTEDKVGDYIFQNMNLAQGPKVVVIGGGTGLSNLLRGLKTKTSNLTAIVTVADDGGSSGRLREDLQIIAPGDLRNCLVALAEKEGLMEELFQYRFKGSGDLSGHSFGNLFLAALTQMLHGDMEEALDASSKILKVRGRVIPSTTEPVFLVGELEDGTLVHGESQIPQSGKRIRRIFMDPDQPVAEGAALQAIDEADAIIIGPGSLYTSIIPNLLVDKVVEHIRASNASKIYICNVMTQPGETIGYTVADHVQAIYDHTGKDLIDMVIVNDTAVSPETKDQYEKAGSKQVEIDDARLKELGLSVVRANLLNEENKAIHNSEKLGKIVMDVVYAVQTDIEPHILEYYLRRAGK